MSSENINITRHNYEEYFLLYVDNELSAAERMAVETFVSSHPDLREELDILLQATVLEAPPAFLEDKSFLMADSMKLNAMDDSLLLYLDNELAGEEKSKVEKMLATNPDYKLQFDLLLRTRLQPEQITYPFKSELYRKTERAIGAYWLRVAAAVIVIAALSLVYFLNGDSTTTPPVVADADRKQEQVVEPDKDQVAVVPAEENSLPAEIKKERSNKDVHVPVRQQQTPEENNEQLAYSPVESQTDPGTVTTNNLDTRTNVDTRTTADVVDAGKDPQQIINTRAVTDPADGSYNSKEEVVTTPKDYAFTEEKGSSVKGLLRKATRFIEKRTGLNPVNDDDELLIGVVSIKLK